MRTLVHFDKLVDIGLRIIPLWENTKVPMCKGWTTWNKLQCREIVQRYPDANIGLLLGDIIDVEGDSQSANDTINKLIGDYPHPCYMSTKSIHHLFINPDPNLQIVKFQNIEFRGHKHQSVLPPSHHQGVYYEWINSCFPIPEMPIRLSNFYRKIRDKALNKKSNHAGYMSVYCVNCSKKTFIHKRRFDLELESFNKIQMKWECRKCRIIDVRSICKDVRKRMRREK